ncbi:MAG: hypothetical protein ACOX0Q_03725 [Syntrophomonadaceae bacterium]
MKETSPTRTGVPKILPVLIAAILAGMFYYAYYLDDVEIASPDKTVDHFYQAYLARDYETVARDLSVFWSVNYLPQYMDMSPAELLDNRAEIEKETAAMLKSLEAEQPFEEGISVEVLMEYTKTGEYSALVVYQVMHEGEPIQKEVALLIREAGDYKIINLSPIRESDLEMVQNYSLDQLDESFKQLLEV